MTELVGADKASDSKLLGQFLECRDDAAFGEIVRRHGPMVLGICRRVLGNLPDAEDAFQAAFLVLAMRGESIREKTMLAGWLWGVARQTALRVRTARLRRLAREQRLREVAALRAESAGDDPETQAILESEMDRLAPKHRTPVVMCYLEGKTNREAAQLLGWPEGTVATRLREARELLRRRLMRKGIGADPQTLGGKLAGSLAPAVVPVALASSTIHAATGATAAGAVAAGHSFTIAKGVVKVMAYSKAKATAIGVLAFLLVGGGAVSVGYYVFRGDDPAMARQPTAALPAGAGATTTAAPMLMWADPATSRPVYSGPPVVGFVQTPDGKPVTGATVTYTYGNVYTQISVGPNGYRVPPVARTQADGRFQFVPTQPDPRSVAVQTADGYGMASVSSLPATPIRLIPWSRVEGTAKVGSHPAANAQVRFNSNNSSPFNNADRILVMITGSSQTDADGHFVLGKVPAGSVYIDVSAQGQSTTTARTRVDVQSGSTTTVMIGGMGRPVIGRVTPVPSTSNGRATLMTQPIPYPRSLQIASTQMATTNPAERRKLMAEFQKSPEYVAYRNAQMKAQQVVPREAPVDAEGRFRIEDVPPGEYQLDVSYYFSDRTATSSNYVENVGRANVHVTVPEMPGGRSDEALDAGEIHLIIPKRVVVGQPVPEVSGTTPQGQTVKLSDYRGKYVLFFISRFAMAGETVWQDAVKSKVLRDRYRGDSRFEMLMFSGRQGPQGAASVADLAKQSGIDWPVLTLIGQPAEEYNSSGEMILLVDPQGKLVAKNMNAPTAYMRVDEVLGMTTAASASIGMDGAQIAIGHLPPGTPEGTRFTNVPPASNTDAATTGTFTVVDGRGTEPTDSVSRLKDGREASGDDAPSQNFFFETGTLEGRLKLDLGRTISVGQVNTYSRHKNWRGPQVYLLYASDGSAPEFDASPKIGTDPAAVGWKKIAAVDARLKDGLIGGRYAVSVSHPSGSLGKYRYLLFEMYPSETRDPFGQAFYGEIDVVEGR